MPCPREKVETTPSPGLSSALSELLQCESRVMASSPVLLLIGRMPMF